MIRPSIEIPVACSAQTHIVPLPDTDRTLHSKLT